MSRYGRAPVPEADRFWPKVDKTPTCWLWTAAWMDIGYGKFRVGSMVDNTRRLMPAHRWAYEQEKGLIPEGLELDHLCGVVQCVRPDHLEAVTHHENTRRRT